MSLTKERITRSKDRAALALGNPKVDLALLERARAVADATRHSKAATYELSRPFGDGEGVSNSSGLRQRVRK